MAILTIRDGKDAAEIKFDETQVITLGRAERNILKVAHDPRVSNEHCKIYYSPEHKAFVLSDLRSTNGTLLNYNRIADDIVLTDNDKIQIGDTRIVFQSEAGEKDETKTKKILKLAKHQKDAGAEDGKMGTETVIVPLNYDMIKTEPQAKVLENLNFAPGEIIGEKYVIIALISAFKFGNIYKVKSATAKTAQPKSYALKIYNMAFDRHHPAVIDFNNTMNRLQQLDHPAFVKVLDFGNQHGLCYYVMEYISAPDLNTRIAQSAPLYEYDSLQILQAIAAALDYLWREKQIFHGAFSPADIFVADNNQIKLNSFGLSSWVARHVARQMAVSLPWYISPEEIQGQTMDWRTDMYALGIIFYQLLTGYVPFHSEESYEQLYHLHLSAALPSTKEVNPNIWLSDATLEILRTMTAKAPGDRYPSWAEMLGAAAAAFDQFVKEPAEKPAEEEGKSAAEKEKPAVEEEPRGPYDMERFDKILSRQFLQFFSSDEEENEKDGEDKENGVE